MTIHYLTRGPLDLTDALHRTLGCEIVAGACRTHQRAMDTPRLGCPLADAMARYGRASR